MPELHLFAFAYLSPSAYLPHRSSAGRSRSGAVEDPVFSCVRTRSMAAHMEEEDIGWPPARCSAWGNTSGTGLQGLGGGRDNTSSTGLQGLGGVQGNSSGGGLQGLGSGWVNASGAGLQGSVSGAGARRSTAEYSRANTRAGLRSTADRCAYRR